MREKQAKDDENEDIGDNVDPPHGEDAECTPGGDLYKLLKIEVEQ